MPKKKTIRTIPQIRTPAAEQDPKERVGNFSGAVPFRLRKIVPTDCVQTIKH